MKSHLVRIILPYLLVVGVMAAPATAQHASATAHHAPVGPAPADPQGPFGVFVHGHYQRMARHGDFSGRVAVSAVQGSDRYAVGALAGRMGEITIIGGRVYLRRLPALTESARHTLSAIFRHWLRDVLESRT
ncbi:MAG: hypothetical protein ABT940_11230 [Alphaproteobacteria bacterium]